MPEPFASVRWNSHVHRLDTGLYSHPKEFGNGSESMSTPWEKSPLPEAQGRVEPATLHQRRTASPTHY